MLKCAKPVKIDANADANVRDPSMADDATMSNTDFAAAGNLRAVSAGSGGGRVRPSTTSSSAGCGYSASSAAFWGYANPVATDKDIEMLPPPSWVLNSYEYRHYPREGETPEQTRDRVNKMEFLQYVEREVGKEKADEAARLAAQKRKEREAQGVFGDFRQAMDNVQPGGAFAAPSGGQEGGRGSGGVRGSGGGRGSAVNARGGSRGTTRGRGGHESLNVLHWDL